MLGDCRRSGGTQSPEERRGFQGFEEAVGTMEGQGVAASAASEAGRTSEPAVGAVVAAGFDDPGVSHAISDDSGSGDGQRHNGDDTVVIPALGRPEASEPGPGTSPAGSAGEPSGPAGSSAAACCSTSRECDGCPGWSRVTT